MLGRTSSSGFEQDAGLGKSSPQHLSCLLEALISATKRSGSKLQCAFAPCKAEPTCTCHSQRPPPWTTLHAHRALLRVRGSMAFSGEAADRLSPMQHSPRCEGFSFLPSETGTANHGRAPLLPLARWRQAYRFIANAKHGRLAGQAKYVSDRFRQRYHTGTQLCFRLHYQVASGLAASRRILVGLLHSFSFITSSEQLRHNHKTSLLGSSTLCNRVQNPHSRILLVFCRLRHISLCQARTSWRVSCAAGQTSKMTP